MDSKTTDKDFREQLTNDEYRVLRERGTEPAFTGEYWDTKTPGRYTCRGCGELLFDSQAKFDSGSGWPSFTAPIEDESVCEIVDDSHGMIRTEVTCANCESHLGHVFPDGPGEGGQRYCINSLSLRLIESAD